MTVVTKVFGLIICALALPLFAEPKKLQYTIIETAAHDSSFFTQGFELYGDYIVESSGLYGKSFVTRYRADTGEVSMSKRLPHHVFAEGLTIFDKQLFILTWKEGQVFVFDAETFAYQRLMSYQGEGWGITHNGTHLITSNGSNTLSFRSPENFISQRTVHVHDSSKSYQQINELEYAENWIWANMWRKNQILAINSETGKVEGLLDLSALSKANVHQPGTSVLNGIAFDKKSKAFWVTGKLWPNRYLIKIRWPKDEINAPKGKDNRS